MFTYYLHAILIWSGLRSSVLLFFCAREKWREATNIHTYGSIFPMAVSSRGEGEDVQSGPIQKAWKRVQRHTGPAGTNPGPLGLHRLLGTPPFGLDETQTTFLKEE